MRIRGDEERMQFGIAALKSEREENDTEENERN